MGLLRVVCMGLLAAVARTQGLPDCNVGASPSTVSSTEEAAALAASLNCSNGDFAVEWVGRVEVTETIHITNGTSLNITGVGPHAIVDGRNVTQLFYVEDDSRLRLSDITLTYGSAAKGGAIFAWWSSVSFSGNVTFVSNSASGRGGAIYAYRTTLSWKGDGPQFRYNSAGGSGGAIFASATDVSWDGDEADFSNNSAGEHGGAISVVISSSVTWTGNSARFRYNTAQMSGSTIFARDSDVYAGGNGTEFTNNHAQNYGGAIYATDASTLSWDGFPIFSKNVAGKDGGAIALVDFGVERAANISGATFVENTSENGGAIYVYNVMNGLNFTDVEFQSNSASSAGGAFAAYAGTDDLPATFSSCLFWNNTANDTGGAIETVSGEHEFISCDFTGNIAGERGGKPCVSKETCR